MTGKKTGLPPASLYIHVPFCSKKCPYCHFFVLPNSLESQKLFIKTLYQEWFLESRVLEGKELVSIYFGGGTPSLLAPSILHDLLEEIRKGPIAISKNCEITLEGNPEKTTKEGMQDFLKAGINRVSLGIQSFDEDLLKILGRTHSAEEGKKAVYASHEAGITNISIDLMYELPHQTISTWEHSIEEAIKLPITHLSLYNLVFEPNTVFYKKRSSLTPNLPNEEDALAMLNIATKKFPEADLARYEISAFAKKGYESVHNTGYWTGRPFLGLGPSAFSYLEGRRFRKTSHLKKWAESIEKGLTSEDFTEKLTPEASQKELLAIELRLLKGVDLVKFPSLFPSLAESVETLVAKNLLKKEDSILSLTEEGLKFYDTVASELI